GAALRHVRYVSVALQVLAVQIRGQGRPDVRAHRIPARFCASGPSASQPTVVDERRGNGCWNQLLRFLAIGPQDRHAQPSGPDRRARARALEPPFFRPAPATVCTSRATMGAVSASLAVHDPARSSRSTLSHTQTMPNPGTERVSYGETEQIALTLAEEKASRCGPRRIRTAGEARSSKKFGAQNRLGPSPSGSC